MNVPPDSTRFERHGGLDAGWFIPAGMFDAHSVVYSGGLGEDASFDLDLISRYSCQVWAFDPTTTLPSMSTGTLRRRGKA